MAISATYLQLQQQIADELGDRQDLLTPLSDSALTFSPIQNAVRSAIAKWEREPFYFNEVYSQNLFNTSPGQEFYSSSAAGMVANSPGILKLHVLISSNRYTLNVRTWQYLEDVSTNPAVTGQPTEYAYFAEQMRLYPIPNGVYPITLSATQRAAEMTEDGDTSVWTTDAFDLIRSESKLILAQEVLYDDELANRCRIAIYGNPAVPKERGYLSALKGESTRRARSKITPSQF